MKATFYTLVVAMCMGYQDLAAGEAIGDGVQFENNIQVAGKGAGHSLQDSIPSPWSDIDLTGESMKPGYPFVVPDERTFPWLPVIGGVVGAGVITYLVVDGDDDPADCTFTAIAQTIGSTCGQANGSASLTVAPASDYTYAWSNASTSSSINNVQSGSYTVTVTRAGTTCNRVVTVVIPNTDFPFAADLSLVSANCGAHNGSASISVNPVGQYSYAWSTGGSGTSQSNLASGTYMVTVSSGSCSQTFNLTVGEIPPQFDINIHPIPATCGMSNGSALAVVTKGDYSFLWSNGQTGAGIGNVPPGEYTVTVTINGTSCQKTSSVVIGEMPANFTISFDVVQASCGESDGVITATVSQAGQYDFLWSNGNPTSSLTGVPAGEYQLTVTLSGTTCIVTSSVQLSEAPAFNITITTTQAQCGVSDGSTSATVDPPGTYNYVWPNGSTETTAENLAAGSYVLTVTNSGGCSSTSAFTITAIPADFIVDVSTVPGNCLGQGTDIIINTQTHGAGPMEFTLAGLDGIHMFTAAPGTVNVSTFFIILPGQWQIIVRDMSLSGECREHMEVSVDDNTTVTPQDDQYSTFVDQPVSGNVLDNDSGLTLTIGDYTEPAGGTLVLNTDGSFTFIPPAGVTGQFSFQYQVTDVCGNTGIGNVTITVNSADCVFDATFALIHANCGFENGSITITMTPPGEYTYQWSNGASSQDLVSVIAGIYSVTITSVPLMCNKEYVVQVNELQNTYIEDSNAFPGNCSGEGDIIIVLSSPGNGPLVLIIDGPEGTNQFTLPTGGHNLSASMNIPSGTYSITVYDEAAGEQCSETIEIIVPDDTPAVNAMDDVYQTPFNIPVDGNVLDNDSGLNLTLTDVTQIIGGLVDFIADGSFTFIPDPGFSGVGGFTYMVTDACGTTATAFVEITVKLGVCDFTTEFSSTNAACGLETGSVSVIVDPPATYFYEWSNGESGETITNVGAGMYSVTIEDVNLGCSLTFDTEINEDPSEYISDLELVQPMCPEPGDIRFMLSSPSNGPFEITIVHPDGTEVVIEVPEGQVSLLEYIPISEGTYAITVIDVNAGSACSEEITVTLEGSSMLEIMVEAIIPPSEPTSMDGEILVTVSVPTTAPYTIWLNGDEWGLTLEPFASIEGVGAGTFQVQLQDANGCFSNILEVVVPPAGTLGLEVGFGLGMTQSEPIVTPEQPASNIQPVIKSFIDMGLNYRAAGIVHVNSFGIYSDVYSARPLYRLTHMVELWQHEYRGVHFKAHGGLSLDMINEIPTQQYWTIQGSASKKIGRVMTCHATISARGWRRIEMPVVEMGVRMRVVGK